VAGFEPAGLDGDACPPEHPAAAISTISNAARMRADLVV
jgi:hypothetical protein